MRTATTIVRCLEVGVLVENCLGEVIILTHLSRLDGVLVLVLLLTAVSYGSIIYDDQPEQTRANRHKFRSPQDRHSFYISLHFDSLFYTEEVSLSLLRTSCLIRQIALSGALKLNVCEIVCGFQTEIGMLPMAQKRARQALICCVDIWQTFHE